MNKDKLFKILLPICFWMTLWIIASRLINSSIVFPGAAEVLGHLFALIKTASFWESTFISLCRILAGFAIGVFSALILSALSASCRFCDYIITPIIRIIRATPVASFIILLMICFIYGEVPVAASSLMVCPVVYTNICEGIQTVDKGFIELARAYSFSNLKKLKAIYIPSLIPYFSAACTNSIGLAWKSGIAAEVLCRPKYAVGSNIYYSKAYLETADLFAWTIVVIILSMLIEKIIKYLLKKGGHRK